jgi:1,2-dihydroxy-3-keto-5-methylthiopentene dioxygenase
MTHLAIYDEHDPSTPVSATGDGDEIAAALAEIGVRFDRWPTRDVADGADVLAAYAPEVDRLSAAHGYKSVDVVRVTPDHPDRAAMRGKFLSEHIHGDDEVRFFVEGSGLFTLRHDGRIFAIRCEQGDLIGVPAGTRHWFDMGAEPRFTAIRLFTTPDGWVADFTGDPIADRFPRHEPAAA